MVKNFTNCGSSSDSYEDFMMYDDEFCLPETAVFIKKEKHDDKILWSIYDAEGSRLAVAEDRACAFEIAKQNDYQANSVH